MHALTSHAQAQPTHKTATQFYLHPCQQPQVTIPPTMPAGHPDFDTPSDDPYHNAVKDVTFKYLLHHLWLILNYKTFLQNTGAIYKPFPPYKPTDPDQMPVKRRKHYSTTKPNYVFNSKHFYLARYRSMLTRCYKTTDRNYQRKYGSKIITGSWISRPWTGPDPLHPTPASFLLYCITLESVARRNHPTDSIDRINPNLGYAPHLVRFLDATGQANNQNPQQATTPFHLKISPNHHKFFRKLIAGKNKGKKSQLELTDALINAIKQSKQRKQSRK